MSTPFEERADLVNRTPGRSLASIAASRRSRFRPRRRRHARLARLALVFLGVLAPHSPPAGASRWFIPSPSFPRSVRPKRGGGWPHARTDPRRRAVVRRRVRRWVWASSMAINGTSELGRRMRARWTCPWTRRVRSPYAGTFPARHLAWNPPASRPAANTWVRGYPNVLYGINQCNASTSPPVSAGLRLPMEVDAIRSDLIGTTTYSAHTPGVTYDVAYDMWLSSSDTKSPCQTNGTLEVMVWTDYNELALLPASLKVATITVPYSVNGTVRPGNQEWSIYVTDVYGGGQTEPWGGRSGAVLDKRQRRPIGHRERGSELCPVRGRYAPPKRLWLAGLPKGLLARHDPVRSGVRARERKCHRRRLVLLLFAAVVLLSQRRVDALAAPPVGSPVLPPPQQRLLQ